MSASVVDVQGLSRQFGKTLALDDIGFRMCDGLVYGLVGANGAGKTTLIKHLLGLLKPQQGTVRVFGLDPVHQPVEVLQRIGYLSEERELPDWMRVGELMRYTAAYHPSWDEEYAQELLATFRLDPKKRVKELSKGMRAQAGLIVAVSHRPDLLILDEPSTGLDAVVRRDILNAIIRAVADDGRTALFSSHLLDEVEMMSDHVVMVDKGKLVLAGELDSIKEQHHRISVTLPDSAERLPQLSGVLSAEGQGARRSIICDAEAGDLSETLSAMGAEVTHSRTASLQEIFVARVGRDRLEDPEPAVVD